MKILFKYKKRIKKNIRINFIIYIIYIYYNMNKKLLIKQSLALLDQNKAKLNNPTFARLQFEIVNKNIQSVKKINDQLQLLNNIDAKKMTFKQFTDLKKLNH